MRSVTVRLDDMRTTILCLGYVGENEHTRINIDAKKMYDQYPSASASLTVCPPEGDSYPAVITRDGDMVIWDIADSDLVAEGSGEIQLSFTQGETVAKTFIGRFKVSRSLVPTGDIPSGLDDFLTRAGAALTAIPETIDEALAEAKASGEFDGADGQDGQDGADGFSPIATVTKNGNKATISITDANGTTTAEVTDGADGAPGQDGAPGIDGFSPRATVSKSGSTATITITDAAGTTTAQISDGEGADIIDDTAGAGDTDKVWSADKSAAEKSSLLTEIMQTGAYYIDRNLFKNPTSVNSNASNVINAAIIDAQTKGLQYCVIPEGEYWITQTIYLKSDVILCGCGIDATTLKIADGCDIDAIRVAEPVNNSGLMDLAIDGNRIENYSVFVNGHHGNAINVWLHYGRIERVRTNWVFKHSLLLNYDTGNSDDGLGFAPEHQNDMGNLNKVLWCDFKDSLLQGVMWGWRTMDSWMCYTNIGSHAANLYLEGGTSRFVGNHFDGDGDNGSGPEYNIYCGDGCNAMVFEGNIFENTQKENIFFRQPSYSNQTMTIIIANNIIRTCSKSQNEQYANIKISGFSSSVPAIDIVISGNQILNPDTNGNNGYAGIHLLYCKNTKIVGNTFFNVGTDDVVIDSTCENVFNDSNLASLVSDVQINGTSILNGYGVANIPLADSNAFGVVKIGTGLQKDSTTNETKIAEANVPTVKAGGSGGTVLTPRRTDAASFYGLAKASGDTTQAQSQNAVGVYTDDAKSKISDMLHAPETVSGSTPSITAKSGVRYICGECSTLTITAPASGCIDVVFESGSTPTVLTVSSAKTGVTAIKWANGFDPTSLDANTTYELNILDGEFGVVGKWT